jgi:hypothetical protein
MKYLSILLALFLLSSFVIASNPCDNVYVTDGNMSEFGNCFANVGFGGAVELVGFIVLAFFCLGLLFMRAPVSTIFPIGTAYCYVAGFLLGFGEIFKSLFYIGIALTGVLIAVVIIKYVKK